MKKPGLKRSIDAKLLQLLVKSVKDYAIFMLDPQGMIVSWNKGAEKIKGFKAKEIIGKHMSVFYTPQDIAKNEPEHNLTLALKKGSYESEGLRLRKDGSTFWADVIFTPLFDQDKKLLGFAKVTRDVTERRRVQEKKEEIAEQEINQKNKQIEDLLESITDGFLAMDGNLRYTYGNKRLEGIFGVPASSILGKTVLEVFPGAAETETFKAIQTAIRENRAVTNEDYYAPLDLWTENRIFPARDGASMFIRDITERKNDELRKSLLSGISLIFNEKAELDDMLAKVLERLADFGKFSMAEAWLIGVDKKKIRLAAIFAKTEGMHTFYQQSTQVREFIMGQGLPGIVWKTQTIQFWPEVDKNKEFMRRGAAKSAGLKTLYGIPIKHNSEVIGALLLGTGREEKQLAGFNKLIESICDYLGAEIKRKHLERELYQVFNFAPDILCIAGVDGYFKKVNPSMSRLLEYTEEELLASPYIDFVHPDDRGTTATEVRHVFKGKPSFYFENRYLTKSGKTKNLAWTATEASDESLLFCVARDITDKKELEDLLNKATTLARIGGWEVDLQKRTIYWSKITREIHEVDTQRQISIEDGTNFYKEGESRQTIVKAMEDAVIKGTPGDVELQIVTAKGNIKWVRVIIESEFSDGKCARLYGSFQDIDARKKAEIASLEALEERNTILESIDDAFFAIDRNWTVLYWNKKAEKLFNTSKSEILSLNLLDAFPAWVGSDAYGKYVQAMQTGQAVQFEHQGQSFSAWLETSIYPSPGGLTAYIKDISTRKTTELRLQELNENLRIQARELASSNAELEQFAYVASHDLQEPLRMVTSFLTLLESKYNEIIDDKGRQYINFAVDGAKRMREIILDLLDFSRVGRSGALPESVDFNRLAEEIIALFRRQIDELGASVTYEHLPVIITHRAPVRQLLQNLVSNSLKYHRKDIPPVIKIACMETGSDYQFSVKDNGIGIAEEYFEKIFIIFQRLHHKDEYSGTGMGLAIARKITENLGGSIWLESAESQGTTFYFTLPKENDGQGNAGTTQ